MFVEGKWEPVETLQDISNIIRKYYNQDVARQMDYLIADMELSYDETKELEELRAEVDDLRDTIESIRNLVY